MQRTMKPTCSLTRKVGLAHLPAPALRACAVPCRRLNPHPRLDPPQRPAHRGRQLVTAPPRRRRRQHPRKEQHPTGLAVAVAALNPLAQHQVLL